MRNETTRAVRELRYRLGDTQQAFAQRTGLAISTVVRYELSRPPKGKALALFQQLAKEHGHRDLWEVFRRALREHLGLDDYSDDKVELVIPRANLAAHLALEKLIGARLDQKARKILRDMRPYTDAERKTVEWVEEASK